MKRIIIIPLCFAILSGCITVSEYVVDYDYSYGGKFAKYSTFNFVNRSGLDDTPYNDLIEEAITNRLGSQGYRLTEKKPNLLILYKIYFEDFDLNTYEQPQLQKWVREANFTPRIDLQEEDPDEEAEIEEEELLEETAEERRQRLEEEYNAFKCELIAGTLYIVLYDQKIRKSVWQGFASGVFGNESFDNNRAVKKAVSKILDEYQVLARGYSQFNP